MPMRLHYSYASPYVRKVMVVAIETGQEDALELTARKVSPVVPEAEVNRDNPLGKVPCLVTDDGEPLFDSRVICEYLDSRHGGAQLFPAAAPARWTALRRQAQADGILDAGILARYEILLRPEERRWPDWVEGQKAKMARALDALEQEAASFGATVDIGTIAVGCALGWLDFRYAADDWRAGRPALAAWFEGFAARPSMTATVPREA
jgi:glutathione S-transferase